MSVNIHGKIYITVAERLELAKKDIKSIMTEVLYQTPVVIKATIVTDKGTFTGISAANPDKTIEKVSPYEVAETSAVGRALAFAGYGVTDSIASAEEIIKAVDPTDSWPDNQALLNEAEKKSIDNKIIGGECSKCGQSISDKVKNYSIDKYGEALCYACQKKGVK
jgi:hypothetical protein